MSRPFADLGGLGYFIVLLSVATVLVLAYRVTAGRRFVHAVLVAVWMAVAVSVVLVILGGG